MLYILFPNFELYPKECDPAFVPEYQTAEVLGIKTMLMDHNKLCALKPDFLKRINHNGGTVVYRGWMVSPKQYEYMYNQIVRFGLNMLVNPIAYKAAHYFPISYPFISEFTPKAVWSTSPLTDSRDLYSFIQSCGKVVLKDFVKTEKGTKFQYIDGTISRDKFRTLLKEFKQIRGELYAGGIVLKKYVQPKPYILSSLIQKPIGDSTVTRTNEWRAFFLNGKLLSFDQNSFLDPLRVDKPPIELVEKIGKNLFNVTPFFTMDFMECVDGNWIVIEVGDAQVSGLCGKQSRIHFFTGIQEKYLNYKKESVTDVDYEEVNIKNLNRN